MTDNTRKEAAEQAPDTGSAGAGSDVRGEWHPPERNGGVQLAKPKAKWYQWFLPRSARESAPRGLQKTSDTSELLRAVSMHLERQALVQDRLLSALERLPEAIDGMRSVGKSAEQQTQVLQDVRQQLQSSVAGMAHFEQALNTMDATNKTAAETVAGLVERSRESEAKLRELVDRSERRVTLLLGILGLAFLTLVGGGLYYGVSGKPLPWAGRAPAAQESAPAPEESSGLVSAPQEPAMATPEALEEPAAEAPAEAAPAEVAPAEAAAEESAVLAEPEPATVEATEAATIEAADPVAETAAPAEAAPEAEVAPEPAVEPAAEAVAEPVAEAVEVLPTEAAVEPPPVESSEPAVESAALEAEASAASVVEGAEPVSDVLQEGGAPAEAEQEGSIIQRVIETLAPAKRE